MIVDAVRVTRPKRHGELEAAGAGAAGVEVDDAVSGLDAGLVGVAADDDGDACGFGVEVEPVDGMDEVEEAASEFYGFGFGELGTGAVGVGVAADGCHGSDLAQSGEYVRIADVSGVEDVVDGMPVGAQGCDGFGAEETVGVGDDAYEHGGSLVVVHPMSQKRDMGHPVMG